MTNSHAQTGESEFMCPTESLVSVVEEDPHLPCLLAALPVHALPVLHCANPPCLAVKHTFAAAVVLLAVLLVVLRGSHGHARR